MRRRETLGGLVGAVMWPLTAAGQAEEMRRLAILMGSRGEDDPEGQALMRVAREGLAAHGWTEGKNLRIDLRWAAGDAARIEAVAAEIVESKPELILANSTPAVAALSRLTKTIPIVVAQAVDLVALGYVSSLAHPGGNITGFTFVDLDLVRKWPELLREVAPAVTRAALLFNPATTPFYAGFVTTLQTSAGPGSFPIVAAPVQDVADLETVIADLAQTAGTGLVVPPTPLFGANRRRVAELALQHRLPSISVNRGFASEGGLLSYGPDPLDIFRRSTAYVDRILRGAKPGGLPVQAPIAYELVVNTRTARALGLTIPLTTLAKADEVIE